MASSLRDNIFRLLDDAGIASASYEHAAISSCESAAEIRTALGLNVIGSKNLLFSGKEKFFLVATHADARIRAKGFRSVTWAKDTRFATDEEIAEILGARSGSIPPLGFERTDFAIFVDEMILSAESYAFTPGVPTESVALSGVSLRELFERVKNPVYIFREEADGYVIEPLHKEA